MGLIEDKLKFIEPYFQVVKFDLDGKVIDSSEEIKAMRQEKNLYDSIPFLSSIADVLRKQKIYADLAFHCIQSDYFGPGEYYDFIFKKEKKDEITWFICDFTHQYQRSIDLQQERNVGMITKEKKDLEKQESLQSIQKNDDSRHIFLKIDSLLVRFKLEDIYYIEAYGDYIKVHDAEKTHISYAKLKSIEEILPIGNFLRIHRSYIINIDKIDTLNQQNVQIRNKILPISLTYKDELLKKIRKLN
ncbi:MAG: LytTR family DNA-binding domain-containing protein [Bacteroidota bacterium]